MILRRKQALPLWLLFLNIFTPQVLASTGDKLPEFRECVEVCEKENCVEGRSLTEIPLLHKLLFWDCPSECDYTCQHIITDRRVAASEEIVQFHGKWPFYRFLGMQEPASVLFSVMNFMAHYTGYAKIKAQVPATYPLRKYYVTFAYFGMASWIFSILFHMRDFTLTEELDYFAAGASVLYGFYYTPIRIFHMDQGGKKAKSVLRAWSVLCLLMYVAHVAYLKLGSWDYTYNMAANVVLGLAQNMLWTWFSIKNYRSTGRFWTTWPGLVVTWLLLAMSFELQDFPPLWGIVDAHSLWHLGTVGPLIVWYNFLLRDAKDDRAGQRIKA